MEKASLLKKVAKASAMVALCSASFVSTYSMAEEKPVASQVVTEQKAPATASSAQPTPPAPVVTSEKVDNPYGLGAVWREGDFVARGTLIIMLLMSAGTWYIIVTKFLEQQQVKKQGQVARQKFWNASTIEQGAKTLDQKSAYRFIAEKAHSSTQSHGSHMLDRIDFNTWVTMTIQRAVEKVQSRLAGGLAFLATVGSTSPFIGLFGTVWGIYHALTAIGVSGQASIDKVAGPVGEALIMTAIGLAVAVPAVLGYNWLIRRNKAILEEVRSFGADVHAVALSGNMVSGDEPAQAKAKTVE
ncbi:MotA/TolQ/ExbB proton channel family protein [Acinetobacter rathckeae]|uniref:MotA/TolQ/ExbB proton channel family protein n=1 Tax=Acinetobacter rathckeae TaxID=2605272 RepID=UPI0018A31AC6|nr:MotA/TolQ/ExbB proton channel family protein [Acinetobacter rathckeae]MBF7687227.1 MotA/TolQ/ExbB proton channel family protein [Acinetobacter rathckeae]MBF7694420.1 MotA/TolQ/ExbB proton channel family protein [Acinetobacter rathckeae]